MKVKTLTIITVFAIGCAACTTPAGSNTQMEKVAPKPQPIYKSMKSIVSIFEIPPAEFSRAVEFYQSILDIPTQEIDMQGTQMGLFPSDGQTVFKGEGSNPSPDGIVIYLNRSDNLQNILDKIETNGGKVIVPKTLIDEQNGYFTMFLDAEGTSARVG